ncbi:MAG: hypothetical protein ACP5N5_04295 [Desulfurococcus sp.]
MVVINMEELLWLLLLVNITASYILWCIFTLRFYGKIKNTYLYLAFPLAILSIVLVFKTNNYYILLPTLLTTLILYIILARNKGRKIILAPLPLIIAILLTMEG